MAEFCHVFFQWFSGIAVSKKKDPAKMPGPGSWLLVG
jgi:hypothetical protein